MCRKKATMLAEADYVHRRLKMLRQKKIQEAEDLLRVFCLCVWGAAITVHGLM